MSPYSAHHPSERREPERSEAEPNPRRRNSLQHGCFYSRRIVRQTRAEFRPSNPEGSRGFESVPLRTRVSDAEKIAVCVAKCLRARRFLSPKSRREMSIDDDVGPFGKILSVSIFWRGLWKFHHKTKVSRESAEFSKQKHFALSIGPGPRRRVNRAPRANFDRFSGESEKSPTRWSDRDSNPRDPSGFEGRNSTRVWRAIQPRIKASVLERICFALDSAVMSRASLNLTAAAAVRIPTQPPQLRQASKRLLAMRA